MRYFILVFFMSAVQLFALDATIKIEKNVDQRARVLITDDSDSISDKSKDIYEIFSEDMIISGHFKVEGGYNNRDTGNPYDMTKVKYQLKYRYDDRDGIAKVSVNLIEKLSSRNVFSGEYKIAVMSRYPFLVHKAVSEMNDALGFKSVKWLNRYIVYAKYTGKKETEVILADFTFRYRKRIIKGGLTLFPCWGDKTQKILYFSDYNGELPVLKRLNLYTGKIDTVTTSQGMLACSDVSSDGKRLLLTMAPEGQADIYEYNTVTNYAKRVTFFSGIDVNGKYLAGENRIVFVSNRLGYPNIFAKDIDARDVDQLVFAGRNNNSCDAFGDKVVFIGKANPTTYNVYLVNSDGSDIRPLSSTGVNQFPRFSADGSTVAYIDKYAGMIHYQGLDSGESLQYRINDGRLQSIDW